MAAMRLFGKQSRRQILGWLAGVAILGAIAIIGSPEWKMPAMGALLGGSVGVILMRYIIGPVLIRRHYRNYKAIKDEVELELVDEGVKFSSVNGSATMPWEKFYRWRQNDRFVLIYLMPRLFYIVPKSVASQGIDIAALVDSLTANVGKEYR